MGISVDSKAPFGMFANTNFPDGWIDPLCLVCKNDDEIVSVQIEMSQLSCGQSNNCPKIVNVTKQAIEKGQCKGRL